VKTRSATSPTGCTDAEPRRLLSRRIPRWGKGERSPPVAGARSHSQRSRERESRSRREERFERDSPQRSEEACPRPHGAHQRVVQHRADARDRRDLRRRCRCGSAGPSGSGLGHRVEGQRAIGARAHGRGGRPGHAAIIGHPPHRSGTRRDRAAGRPRGCKQRRPGRDAGLRRSRAVRSRTTRRSARHRDGRALHRPSVHRCSRLPRQLGMRERSREGDHALRDGPRDWRLVPT